MSEIDVRIEALNSIFATPHRVIEPLIPIHDKAINGDPLFYVKMAIWYNQTNGSVRDHQKVFASRLITGDFIEFRAVGEKLLERMSLRDAHSTIFDVSRKYHNGKSSGKRRRTNKVVYKLIQKLEARSEVDNGLQLLRNAKVVRHLISYFHVPFKSEKLAASLNFKATEGQQKYKAFEALDLISKGDLSEGQICDLIDNYRLPPLQVTGAVKEVTPAIAAAMLKGMSQAETVIYMASFEKRGLTKNPEFMKLVQKKVTKGNKKSSSLRSINAAKSLDVESAKVMTAATDDFVNKLKKIKRKICLAIDKSGSMEEAISTGKEIATILAATVENPEENLKIYVFDKTVTEIPLGNDLSHSGFEAKFRYIRANGMTSLGAVIVKLEKDNFNPHSIVFITDAEESDVPLLSTALNNSSKFYGARLINCKVGKRTYDLKIDKKVIESKGLEIENIDYKGDYYSLPNLVNVISAGGITDTIEEIMSIDIDTFLTEEA